jgi:hypothetical protein
MAEEVLIKEYKFLKVLENSDAFISLDFNYTYMNSKAGVVLGKNQLK